MVATRIRFSAASPRQGLAVRGLLALLAAGALLAPAAPAGAAEGRALTLGIVTFLSGPAAGPFGVPARNAAELLVEAINAGRLPAPYATRGIGGAAVEVVVVDEAGGVTSQVSEFRSLVQRRGVDAVVGYVSSGSCLAVAPVAEELKVLTVLFDCGTPRIFEERDYTYVFRTKAHATMDSVAAARYVLDRFPGITTYGGINQNYAWGQDSWTDFDLAMRALKPEATAKVRLFPKLFAGQYSSEVSALLVSAPDVVHSSFWGGDLESFVFQAGARGLPKAVTLVLTAGESAMFRLKANLPDGVVLGARGPYGVFARPTGLNRWFREAYEDRYGTPPTYPAYHMAQAILGLKIASDTAARGSGGRAPGTRQVVAAFEHLEYEAFGTTVTMALGKGHQAITDTAYGTYRFDRSRGLPTIVDVTYYPARCVNPPEGVKSADWIAGGMKGARCE